VDWKRIKAEYIAGGVSLRRLSEKYGVSFSTIQKKSMEEKWSILRKKGRRKAEEKIIEAVVSKEVEKATNIADVADRLLEKITEVLEGVTTTQDIRHLTSALKDIREIKGVKSEADMREQEARIAKLQREAQEEQKDNEITVTIEGDLEIYSK
jgi:lambda repressor-like predicted transcriptional regulator